MLSSLVFPLTVCFLCIFINGCASNENKRDIQIVPSPGQNLLHAKLVYSEIIDCLASNGDKAGVEISHWEKYDNDKIRFTINFHNRTNKTIYFSLNNIIASDATGSPLHVYTQQEIIKQIHTKEAIQSVFPWLYPKPSWYGLVGVTDDIAYDTRDYILATSILENATLRPDGRVSGILIVKRSPVINLTFSFAGNHPTATFQIK